MEPLIRESISPSHHRSWNHGTAEEPAHVSGAIAAAIDHYAEATTDAPGRRDRLKRYLLERIADPHTHASIAGQTADLVAAGLPLAEVHGVLDQLDDLRRKGACRSPGGFFVTKIRKAAAAHGLTWRTKPTTGKEP